MINIFLFIGALFFLTLIFGKLIEKINIPWVFSALILGALASITHFKDMLNLGTFSFIAQMGMYFLLFIIGFDINLNKIVNKKWFLFKATFFIISLEAFFGSVIFHFIFGYSWAVSLIVGFSFATVGEVVLVPILDRFKITNSKLGGSIIGIGVLDDIIEILVLIVVVSFIGLQSKTDINILLVLVSLGVLFAFTFIFTKLRDNSIQFKFLNIETLFLFSLAVLFLFLGIGEYSKAAPLAAFLAGISLRTFIPDKRLTLFEEEIRTMAYGFFAPIFFFWAGLSMNLSYIFLSPLLVLLVVFVSGGAKILASLLISGRFLSKREAITLGVGLSVRFSTSIAIIKILLDVGILDSELYTVLIASSIILTLIVPILFAFLISKWHLGKIQKRESNYKKLK